MSIVRVSFIIVSCLHWFPPPTSLDYYIVLLPIASVSLIVFLSLSVLVTDSGTRTADSPATSLARASSSTLLVACRSQRCAAPTRSPTPTRTGRCSLVSIKKNPSEICFCIYPCLIPYRNAPEYFILVLTACLIPFSPSHCQNPPEYSIIIFSHSLIPPDPIYKCSCVGLKIFCSIYLKVKWIGQR